jgi:hypothetical protein
VEVGTALRAGSSMVGVVCYGPHSGNVKLLREDGSTTDWINVSTLTRPSEAELAAQPWLTDWTWYAPSGAMAVHIRL